MMFSHRALKFFKPLSSKHQFNFVLGIRFLYNFIFLLSRTKKKVYEMKTTAALHPCQLNHQIILNPIGFIDNMPSEEYQSVFKAYLIKFKRRNTVTCANETIARIANVSISTVKRAKAYFISLGIIQSWPKRGTWSYVLNEFFRDEEIMKQIKKYFSVFISICSLYSGPLSEPVLILKDNIYLTNPTTYKPLIAGARTHEEQVVVSFNKKEQVVYKADYTEEESLVVKSYPVKAQEYAEKEYVRALQKGKTIPNKFSWIRAVCERWTKENPIATQQQTPKQGTSQQRYKEQAPPLRRHHDNFQPGMPVINEPGLRVAEIKIVETDTEFAINLERILHRRINIDKDINPNAGKYPNPFWDKLLPVQQKLIMENIHVDCTCRKFLDYSLEGTLVDFSVRDKASRTEPELDNIPFEELNYTEILD